LPGAKGSTPKPLSKKGLNKLRQKTKKRLVNMQAKEAEDIPGDDGNLNNSIEDLIDPVKNSLDQNDNYEDDNTDNYNVDPSDILVKCHPSLKFSEVKDNSELTNVISILSTIKVPDHPSCPSTMFSNQGPQDEDRSTVQAEDPSNASPAVRDEDASDVRTDVREDPSNARTDVCAEEHSIATDLPPPLYPSSTTPVQPA
jgi:hypothetical protein